MHFGYEPRHAATQPRGSRGRRVLAAGGVGVLLSLAAANGAFADNANNDAQTNGNNIIDAGQSTDVTYQLVNGQGDCDATSTSHVTVDIALGTGESGVTIDPTSFDFVGCGQSNTQLVTFSSDTPGVYDIVHTISGANASDVANHLNFQLTVNSNDSSDPCDSVSTPSNPVFSNGGTGVWYNTDTTPSATSDSGTVTYSQVSGGPYSAAPVLGEGQYTVYAVATSATCNKVSGESHQAFNIDETPPTSSVTGATDGAIYLDSNAPTPTCSNDDNLSGVATGATLYGSPGSSAGQYTVYCNGAIDNAGNEQTTASASVSYTVVSLGNFNANFDGSAVLKVKPNQAIPLKWAFTDGTTNYALLSTASLSSVSSTRCNSVAGSDGTETATEVAAGASGLQLLPDNSYQMNWKATSTTGCRALTVAMTLTAGGNVTHTILVNISK